MTLASGALCGGAVFEWQREPAGDRWCFGCRRHLPHDWVLRNDTPPDEPSWYEPIWVLECSECRKDRTRFGS